MDQEIGQIAGKIWNHLNEYGATSVYQLRQKLEVQERLLHMGLGWLAREGKLTWSLRRRALYVDIQRKG